MKIVQFAFDSGPSNGYLPHNHLKNCVVYTGTHDNDTTVGWYNSLTKSQRNRVNFYVGNHGRDSVESLLRIVFMSVADTAIVPLQDLIGLGSESRMNVPGTAFGNWGWRFDWSIIQGGLARRVRDQLECYGRCNSRQL
jgi:4-alpha-glucanotransferase